MDIYEVEFLFDIGYGNMRVYHTAEANNKHAAIDDGIAFLCKEYGRKNINIEEVAKCAKVIQLNES